MFDPIYNFANEEQVLVLAFIVSTTLFMGYAALCSVWNSFRFVKDDFYILPFIDDNVTGVELLVAIFFACPFFSFVGTVPAGLLIITLNWLWFPCSIIAVLVVIMFIARSVVRLKRQLNEHTNNKSIHS